ncbi:hypothetical protein [Mycobacterium sp. AZCC_0083]|uniref:hypothetical protein n=1 Tax=Mycobacterium sp. AZCC_0083 TaxID=2735882 RepID=UPI001619E4AD|nr:hypothetical protein [Mycobacterium sp. AZCC_0083]MBB5167172.1 hypothetical protein [Mycobacterium sp. AZCC_0083]
MSKNNTINGTPGLKRIVPAGEPIFGLGAKVTGRNLAAISYIVSLEAERRGVPLGIETVFAATGELVSITVKDDTKAEDFVLEVGDAIVLTPQALEAQVLPVSLYNQVFREL